jgi:hypothetical protein
MPPPDRSKHLGSTGNRVEDAVDCGEGHTVEEAARQAVIDAWEADQ